MTSLKRLFEYTTALATGLYLLSIPVATVALVLGSASSSNTVTALGLSAALLMWWPLVRDLIPVAWTVAIYGRWPTRKT
jgi:hypothetical protein